ncbi:hypothetical protein Tco_0948604 [Tanacetum coccineum]
MWKCSTMTSSTPIVHIPPVFHISLVVHFRPVVHISRGYISATSAKSYCCQFKIMLLEGVTIAGRVKAVDTKKEKDKVYNCQSLLRCVQKRFVCDKNNRRSL